ESLEILLYAFSQGVQQLSIGLHQRCELSRSVVYQQFCYIRLSSAVTLELEDNTKPLPTAVYHVVAAVYRQRTSATELDGYAAPISSRCCQLVYSNRTRTPRSSLPGGEVPVSRTTASAPCGYDSSYLNCRNRSSSSTNRFIGVITERSSFNS